MPCCFCVHIQVFIQVMHQSFETPAPPHSRCSGGWRGFSPHIPVHFILVPRLAGNSLEVTVFESPAGLFAGRSKIDLFISCLPTVFFNQCVMLGNNKLFYKGSAMCWKVEVGNCTTHFCPREPRTSLTFTWIKSECPVQARMGGSGGFKWLVHKLWNKRKRWKKCCEVTM